MTLHPGAGQADDGSPKVRVRALGQSLLARGLINESQLDQALIGQRREGGLLGEQLVLSGAVDRRELYATLADLWEIDRVDLVAEPPDPILVRQLSYQVALREGWVPWQRDGGLLTVATSIAPSPQLKARVLEIFDAVAIEFVATTPWELWRSVEHAQRDRILFDSQDKLAEENPLSSAAPGLTLWQRWLPVAVGIALLIAFAFSPYQTFVLVLATANLVFFLSITFKSLATFLAPVRYSRQLEARWRETRERTRRGLPPVWRQRKADADLPEYTILIPVYQEANVLPQVLKSIAALDYPKAKLDVLLLMEEDDLETIQVARAMRPPEYVRLVVVPDGHPKTKPRACNYGLALARGEFVVIYDAEDRPHPQQLREAVAAFDRDELEHAHQLTKAPPLAVVQSPLYYYNADYNVLTRMFAIEYAHWFDAMLPGMDEAGLPLPLGGTSNHFRVSALRAMGAWDPFNVTEDADAGLRASVKGYRVAVIPAATGEEACSQTRAWIKQRTRWIKGYLVTAAVNTRRPVQFARRVGVRGVVGMLGLIMATPIAFLVYPLALGFTIATYIGVQFIGLELPTWVISTSVATFLYGNILMIVTAAIAATRRYNWRIGAFAIFSPVYWLLHSVAAWRALYQVVRDPHRWEKTPHGLTEDYESDAHV